MASFTRLAALASVASLSPVASLPPVASLQQQPRYLSPEPQKTQPDVPVSYRRGSWSPQEDDVLKRMVQKQGAKGWDEISKNIGSRSAKQCRERWHQSLDPRLRHGPITKEEGDVILDWVARKGPQWAEIGRHLKYRSDNAVKNWWNGVQNQSKRKEKALALKRQKASQQDDAPPVSPPIEHSQRSSGIRDFEESLDLPPLLGEAAKKWQNQWLPGVRSFVDLDPRSDM
ncbi:hypothetical protein E4U17_007418 [Claviceps sp. LM77 group G4]|nr:hypothetical protein E4U17_007418 [Claviceps sp. LM77 group G4]KAG6052628.1 hypothetical protein E4U33_000444 [Claviceps sp. LM78 group G4]